MSTRLLLWIFSRKALMYVLITAVVVAVTSCKKEWLEAKPDKALVVPSSIEDFQALLDNTVVFNSNDLFLDEIGAGDFYMLDATYNALKNGGNVVAQLQHSAYGWVPDFDDGEVLTVADWNNCYGRVFNANIILEGIQKIVPANGTEQTAWNNVKGAALFHRAYSHYSIAKAYCRPYVKSTANSDLGTPIRLESDINIPSVRPTVQETYDAIIADLREALNTLPVLSPSVSKIYRLRPTKAAANGMLARVFLSMSNYDSAFKYADQCLQLYSSLLNYNQTPVNLQQSNSLSFPNPSIDNAEVIFSMVAANSGLISTSSPNILVDSVLYSSYSSRDQRRLAFFRPAGSANPGKYTIKNSYGGTAPRFTGLATDEIYLIRAECYARAGNKDGAMGDLNTLLKTRMATTPTYVNDTAATADEALQKVLVERRKELYLRGVRWSDLRRLNLNPQLAVTVVKKINSQTFQLAANSPLYVLPIPTDVILLSGMPQNPR